MTETIKDEQHITCSSCRSKYLNTSESISKYFGFKRLGDRYKICVKCRVRKNKKKVSNPLEALPESQPPKDMNPEGINPINNEAINQCCVCFHELNQDNTAKIKCKHSICKSCVKQMADANEKANIITCPMCRREYCLSVNGEDVEPLLFKIIHKNGYSFGTSYISNLFFYTSKRNLMMGFPGMYIIDRAWVSRMKTILKIVQDFQKSDKCFKPLLLYMYKDGVDSFTLKSNKPENVNELVGMMEFLDLRQSDDCIECFLNSKLGVQLFSAFY